MTYTRSQNNINMVVGKHEIKPKKIEIVVVALLPLLLSFDVFVPMSARLLLFLDTWFVQIYLNVNYD